MSAFSIMLERHQGAPTCSIFWIRKVLGHRRSDAALVRFLDLLIAEQGFPRPLPHYKHGGGLETGVALKSEWLRAAVESWLENNFLPPSAAAMLDRAGEDEAAAAMDAAAFNLGSSCRKAAARETAKPRLVAANDRQQVAA